MNDTKQYSRKQAKRWKSKQTRIAMAQAAQEHFQHLPPQDEPVPNPGQIKNPCDLPMSTTIGRFHSIANNRTPLSGRPHTPLVAKPIYNRKEAFQDHTPNPFYLRNLPSISPGLQRPLLLARRPHPQPQITLENYYITDQYSDQAEEDTTCFNIFLTIPAHAPTDTTTILRDIVSEQITHMTQLMPSIVGHDGLQEAEILCASGSPPLAFRDAPYEGLEPLPSCLVGSPGWHTIRIRTASKAAQALFMLASREAEWDTDPWTLQNFGEARLDILETNIVSILKRQKPFVARRPEPGVSGGLITIDSPQFSGKSAEECLEWLHHSIVNELQTLLKDSRHTQAALDAQTTAYLPQPVQALLQIADALEPTESPSKAWPRSMRRDRDQGGTNANTSKRPPDSSTAIKFRIRKSLYNPLLLQAQPFMIYLHGPEDQRPQPYRVDPPPSTTPARPKRTTRSGTSITNTPSESKATTCSRSRK